RDVNEGGVELRRCCRRGERRILVRCILRLDSGCLLRLAGPGGLERAKFTPGERAAGRSWRNVVNGWCRRRGDRRGGGLGRTDVAEPVRRGGRTGCGGGRGRSLARVCCRREGGKVGEGKCPGLGKALRATRSGPDGVRGGRGRAVEAGGRRIRGCGSCGREGIERNRILVAGIAHGRLRVVEIDAARLGPGAGELAATLVGSLVHPDLPPRKRRLVTPGCHYSLRYR